MDTGVAIAVRYRIAGIEVMRSTQLVENGQYAIIIRA